MLQILPVGFAAPNRQIQGLAIHNVCLTASSSCTPLLDESTTTIHTSASFGAESPSCVSFDMDWNSLPGTLRYNIWMSWSDVPELPVQNDVRPADESADGKDWAWLGSSVLERFRVVDLAIPQSTKNLTIAIQAVNVLCQAESLADAATVIIPVTTS